MPLPSDTVHWDYEITARDRTSGQLHLRLAILRKSKMDEIASLADALDLELRQVGLAQDSERRPIGFNFVGHSKASKEAGGQTTLAMSALVILSLAVFLAALEFSRERDLSTLMAQVKSLEAEAAGAQDLKTQLDSLSSSQSYVSARMNDMTVSGLLAGVTQALPDTAYLTSLALDGNRLVLDGFAQDPQRVIAKLEAMPELQGVQLQPGRPAPRQADRKAFQITAGLERPRP